MENTNGLAFAFKKELAMIQSDVIRELVLLALSFVAPAFFDAPASSTGKYHPSYAQGKGGLVRHTRSVVAFVCFLTNIDINDLGQHVRDRLIAAAILHDTCKSGLKWEGKYTVHEHPILVKSLLDSVELSEEQQAEWDEICDIISAHMGQWNTSPRSSVVLPLPTTHEQKILHQADYLASRPEIYLTEFLETSAAKVEVKREYKSQPATSAQKKYACVLLKKVNSLERKDLCKFQGMEVEVEEMSMAQASTLIAELEEVESTL